MSLYHLFLALLGAIIYRFPSRKMFVIGVTGTKGKSTTVELINAILETAGKKTALLSSVRIKIASVSEDNATDNTMPGRMFIQRFLRRATDAGCEYAIIEATSQGVLQHRHRFINFSGALFLNLHPEHIEAHGSFAAYRNAKLKFFKDVAARGGKKKHFFVNTGDQHHAHFIDAGYPGIMHFFSRERFVKTYLGGAARALGTWFSADFNLENAAAAASVAEAVGIAKDTVLAALKNFRGFAGRMDEVQAQPFRVIVDYAHTPDSLRAVYQTLTTHNLSTQNSSTHKLICVFGSAGGGRDTWKRSEFGRIAAQYCAIAIITNEDPYDEPPEKIMEEIARGWEGEREIRNRELGTRNKELLKIVDRKEAIKEAVTLARSGDTVVITGKGSEHFIHGARGAKIPWSDRDVTREALRSTSRGAFTQETAPRPLGRS